MIAFDQLNMLKYFRKFWDREESLTVFLLMLIVFITLVIPFSHPGETSELFVVAFFSLLLITGVWTTVGSPFLTGVAIFLAVCASAFDIYQELYRPTGLMLFIAEAVSLPILLLFLLVLVRSVNRAGPVTSHRVKGGIAIYLLLGLTWAEVYRLIEIVSPGSFNGINHSDFGLSFVYFSFVTLTTVGYGDITPVHSFARAFANLEALMGQLFPAIFIAQLVSREVQARAERDK